MDSFFGFDKTKPPDFVSQDGNVKWWNCKSLTEWAIEARLTNIRGWAVTDPLGESYVLTDGTSAIFSTQRFEDACVHIDIMKLNKEMQ